MNKAKVQSTGKVDNVSSAYETQPAFIQPRRNGLMRTAGNRRAVTALSSGLLIVSVILQTYSAAALASQQSQHAGSPDEVVREFYNWYLRAQFPEPKR